MKRLGILMGWALAAWAAADSVLIQNADVYPVTAAPMKGVSLLIQDGKIAEIGPKLVAPKGTPVIDAKGLRVYPGMLDSGTQLGLSEVSGVRVTVDTGELGEFMPQLRALVAVNPDSEHFPVSRVNGITSAMTLPMAGGGRGGGGGQIISGQAALIHTDGWTWEDMEINRSAAMYLNFPSLGGRGGRGGGVPDNTLEAPQAAETGGAGAQRTYLDQIAKINAFFDDARNYQKAKAANEPGLRHDLKFEAMLPVLEGKEPMAVSAARANAIHDAITFADKQNIKIVILEPREIGKAGGELKAKNIPVILGPLLALPDGEDAPYDQAMSLALEAYKAGVKFALGTFSNQFIRNLPYQAATAVAFGLPYDEALKAVTINPAQIWGAGDKLGSVEKGKVADLMITDGDPLEIQTQVKRLFIKGREVSLSNKQVRLYERYMGRQ
jgi:imidazolonepropionase-like amidohydrolase